MLVALSIGKSHAFVPSAPLALPMRDPTLLHSSHPILVSSISNLRTFPVAQLIPEKAKKTSQEVFHGLSVQWGRLLKFMKTEHQVLEVTFGWKKKLTAFVLALTLMWTAIPAAEPANSGSWWGRTTTSRVAKRKTYVLGGNSRRKASTRRVVRRGSKGKRPLLFKTSGRSWQRRRGKQVTTIGSAARTLGSLLMISAVVGTLQRKKMLKLINSRSQAVLPSFVDTDSLQHTPTTMSALGPGRSLLQISIAIHVPDRDDWNSIISVLERKTNAAKFDRRISHALLTSQVAMELARRRSSMSAADSFYRHYRKSNQAQHDFEKRAILERQKYATPGIHDKGCVKEYHQNKALLGETVIGSLSPGLPSQVRQTMAVVTILAAIDGDATHISDFQSPSDVTKSLQLLASHAKVEDCLHNVEILWTPESSQESLKPKDVLEEYPNLRAF